MISLAGSHRSGKTTLAKAYAEEFGLQFLPTQSSQVFKRLGLDPQSDYRFSDRLFIQNEILMDAIDIYKSASTNRCITDRSPIDMLAYMMADIQRETLTKSEDLRFMDYMHKCIETANRYISVLIILSPGIEVVEDETKAPVTFGYIQHISSLIKGISLNESIEMPKYYIGNRVTDLSKRVIAMHGAITKANNSTLLGLQESVEVH